MQKTPPFNTGKVMIGINYQPKQQYPMSDFEYRLQESLIQRNNRASAAFDIVCWVIAASLLSWLYLVV